MVQSLYRDLDIKILAILEVDGPLTRQELIRRLDLPRTTVYDHLTKLTLCGSIIKFTKKRMKNGRVVRGRPNAYWSVNNYERQQKTPNSHIRDIG